MYIQIHKSTYIAPAAQAPALAPARLRKRHTPHTPLARAPRSSAHVVVRAAVVVVGHRILPRLCRPCHRRHCDSRCPFIAVAGLDALAVVVLVVVVAAALVAAVAFVVVVTPAAAFVVVVTANAALVVVAAVVES